MTGSCSAAAHSYITTPLPCPPRRDYDLAQGSPLNKDDLAAGLARIVALDYVLVLGDVSRSGRRLFG
jgi:hypothetical protein